MAGYNNFRSSTQIESERQELREARTQFLEKAKADYEKSERRRERARLAGEGTWMLSSVTERIEKEQKALEKAKEKKKKKKKEKKQKKKQKKEKKRKRQSSSSDSDSSEEDTAWVVKGEDKQPARPLPGPTLQRDSWMESPLMTDLVPTVTRAELRERQRGEEDRKKAEAARLLAQPGQHSRELNPYWKDGGTGLPENKASSAADLGSCGDGGLSWLTKAMQRCQQQAKDEGRSLEDVAAERYGSLERLKDMIKEAERARGGGGRRQQGSQRTSQGPRERDSGRDDDGKTDRRERRDSRERERGDRERERRDRDGGLSSRDRQGDRLNRDRDSDRLNRDRDGDRPSRGSHHDRSAGHSLGGLSERRGFVRPSNDSDDEPSPPPRKRTFMKPPVDDAREFSSSSSSSMKGRFVRPNDDSDEDDKVKGRADSGRQTDGDRRGGRRDGGRSSGGGWRKTPAAAASSQGGRSEEGKGGGGDRSHRRRSPSSASSGSQSDSSSSGSESSGDDRGSSRGEQKEGQAAAAAVSAPVARVLSEDEMNSLGARILRAELMGEEDMARQLKAQLEQAQKAKESAQQTKAEGSAHTGSGAGGGGRQEDEEDNTVVLTRTGRDGLVRPLPEQEFDRDMSGGKKRRKKMKNVTTHGKAGERTQYFDDDERHDLKSLVHMEKLGTAEDQNAMFARLAGRNAEKTDDDFQVDDMFLSKAARQQSGAISEERERSKAIFEHKKVSTAMEKCQQCFNKVPKHLLIAIGSKVYLSLPAHRSLTPGHCLIVPMQHVSAATALDEDVWTEIQTFRKQLVQMFAAQDQDVMFMETSMHLRHFPHMVLECVPLEREVGDLAPIYFKKAIQDAGPEWSNNKKVVDLSRKDIRHSVPKGFPYFSVDFGLQGGFAHVIEDEKTFPSYFGREIVGGMIDAEPGLWRKPHREGFEDQRRKVLEFEKWWKPYDFTAA